MNISDLNTKELAIFNGIGEGLSSQAIAKKIGIKPQTVQTYRYRILAKLGLKSTTEIVKAWIWEELNSEKGFFVNERDLGVHYFLYDDVKEVLSIKD